jgi:hypothetical protein
MENNTEKLLNYHIFPPFVDAYKESLFDNKKVSIAEIERLMKNHAIDWGGEVVSKCILEGKDMPKHDGKVVLCCAYIYNGEIYEKDYLIVLDEFGGDWYDKLQFIEGEVKSEWDVT